LVVSIAAAQCDSGGYSVANIHSSTIGMTTFGTTTNRGGDMSESGYQLRPVGQVESRLTDPTAAPKQGDEGAPTARIVFRPEFLPAAADLHAGDRVLVLTWLHRGDREVLSVHPRGDPRRPRQGVFSTRSQDRPNPIGLHPVTVVDVEPDAIVVRDLEAIAGTPVLDLKPVLGAVRER